MKKLLMLLLAVTLVGALTACGGGQPSSGEAAEDTAAAEGEGAEGSGATVDVNVTATDFKFDQPEYRVKAGDTVNLTFASSQGNHGLKINGLEIELADGQSSTFTPDKGEYELECSIMCGTGHKDMVAKLIVE
ncbi:cupredoxin domain-containing protein [Paenibacillus alkalitolerans]|uniref:cytochrome C oxidase subunit II n=1 Tax=Paenibacillus alkalitolerans TaxID=2799335 RepID=UPI0018F4441E|nr:cytochrome C oxidase subunit II [Paenibacillus alkalitolerans]